ncbi:MAG: 4Fe-4S binding protein [Candidatus Jordarchaeales archaeon]
MAEQVEVRKEAEFEEERMLFKWSTEKLEKKLIYDAERCVGCGLCKEVCPSNAIELGPIPEIAMGEVEAPKIMINQDACSYCGLCSAVCPVKAIRFEMKGKSILEMEEYPRLIKEVKVDEEKCAPCLICQYTCPNDAIKVNLSIKKKDKLVRYKEKPPGKIEGTIRIDKEKCVLCGRCEVLCNAIEISWKDVKPNDPRPGYDIRVVEEECDYCGLCKEVCPYDAIEVECKTKVEREIEKPEVSGKVEVNLDDCITCGWCAKSCPKKAITVNKAFEGELSITDIDKCDPVGCKACLKICPGNVWFVPETLEEKKRFPKIAFVTDYCGFCGACQNACPVKIIKVKRTKVRYTKPKGMAWSNAWERAFKKLIGKAGDQPKARLPRIEREPVTPIVEEEGVIPKPRPDLMQRFIDVMERLKGLLSDRGARVLLERGKTEKLLEKFREAV